MNNIALKQKLSSDELSILNIEFSNRKKEKLITWLLWLLFGALGAHRYYLGKTSSAILMTLTLGGFGVWALVDLFLISGMIQNVNDEIEYNIIQQIIFMRIPKGSTDHNLKMF